MPADDEIKDIKRRVEILEIIVFGKATVSNIEYFSADIVYELKDEKVKAKIYFNR